MAAEQAALVPLHTRFSPLTSANFVEMLTLSSVLEARKFTSSNAQLIFSRVKLGNREELSVDRLQEGLRQVAVQKHVSYDEIVDQIMSRTLKRTEDPGEIEEKVDPASGHPYFVNVRTGKSAWLREEVMRYSAAPPAIPPVSNTSGSSPGTGVTAGVSAGAGAGAGAGVSAATVATGTASASSAAVQRATSAASGSLRTADTGSSRTASAGQASSSAATASAMLAALPSCGYLKLDHLGKRGAGKGGVGWNRRWFVLRDDALEYHATEEDCRAGNTPLGLMELESDTALRRGDRSMFQVVAGSRAMSEATPQQVREAKAGGTGKIQRTWVIQAEGSLEQERWLNAIREKLAVLKGQRSKKHSIGMSNIHGALNHVGSSMRDVSISSGRSNPADIGGDFGFDDMGTETPPTDEFTTEATAAALGSAQPRIRTEGFMSKKGHKRRNWTRRYFRLDIKKGILSYFKPQTMLSQEQEKGTINLDGVRVMPSTTHCEFVLEEKTTGRAYHVRAETEEECEQWKYSISYTASITVPVLNA